MGKAGKVIVFVFVSLIILGVLAVLKHGGGLVVTWLGGVAIALMYKIMFGKKDDETNDQNKDITLKK